MLRPELAATLVSGRAFIETVPASGGTPRRFSTDSARAYQILPRWSPDGSRIVAADFNYETNLTDLLVMPATGGAGSRLPSAPDVWAHDPRWTADGRSLVYRSARTMIRFVTADVSRVLAAPLP